MHRTKARPLPSGRITPQGALCVAAGSGMAGTALLLAGTNPVVAALGLGNIVLYGCVASRVLVCGRTCVCVVVVVVVVYAHFSVCNPRLER